MKQLHKKMVQMTSIVHFQINDSGVTRGCGKQLEM